jgi:Tol biopolymer transport system component
MTKGVLRHAPLWGAMGAVLLASSASAQSPIPTAGASAGVPDPAGRIAFGRITRFDGFYGPVVALWAIDPDGSDLAQLTDGESAFPAWSPDGRRLAFTTGLPDGTWQIASSAPDGSDRRNLTSGAPFSEVPNWAADGSWLAFDRSTVGSDDAAFHTTLWRMDADGSGVAPLGETSTFDVEPKIAPDGAAILFERLDLTGGSQRNTLMMRDLRTGQETVIEAAGHAVEHAVWSPDGAWILYQVSPWLGVDLPSPQLERIAADGSGRPQVVVAGTATQKGFKPAYAPSGDQIVFGCQGPDSDALCIAKSDGSGLAILVDAADSDEHFASWGVNATGG